MSGISQSGADAPKCAPRVLLAVCGGIAAYKACEVLRSLQKRGCEVRVCMTVEAERFVGAATFGTLSHASVLRSLFDEDNADPVPHISLAGWADAALVVPATANVMAKLACGLADDALTTTLLALPAATPLLVAPAMNVHMWQSPATRANRETLLSRGVHLIEPDTGRLACGDVGEGKLAPVEQIVDETMACLTTRAYGSDMENAEPELTLTRSLDLVGQHILITAGPTHEAIDPVRFIANASSGKMGFAIAEACRQHGADVTIVAGPCQQPTPRGVERIDVTSAAEMHQAALEVFEDCDAAICAAAVADYTPAEPADHKLKKGKEELDQIRLVRTADILADLSAKKGGRIVVGFAAETCDLIPHAQEKLERKGCDLIVANDVSRDDSTFGSDTNRVSLVSASGVDRLPTLSKHEVAEAIVERLSALLRGPETQFSLDRTVVMTALGLDEDPLGDDAHDEGGSTSVRPAPGAPARKDPKGR